MAEDSWTSDVCHAEALPELCKWTPVSIPLRRCSDMSGLRYSSTRCASAGRDSPTCLSMSAYAKVGCTVCHTLKADGSASSTKSKDTSGLFLSNESAVAQPAGPPPTIVTRASLGTRSAPLLEDCAHTVIHHRSIHSPRNSNAIDSTRVRVKAASGVLELQVEFSVPLRGTSNVKARIFCQAKSRWADNSQRRGGGVEHFR